MALTIKIGNPKDEHTGYLSINSLHSFVIDSRRWMSVEHYLLGKRFEGSSLEEKIQKSKTIQLAKLAATPKRITNSASDGSIFKTLEYEGGVDPLPSSQVRDLYLKGALMEKFKQNSIIRQKLIDTKGTIITDKTDPEYALVLMEVRDDLITSKRKSDEIISEKRCFEDVKSDALDESLMEVIYKVAGTIKKLELVEDFHPGMFEDVLYNAGFGESHFQGLHVWIEKMSGSWSDVMRRCPKYYSIHKKVMNWLTSKNLKGYDDSKYIESSLLISSFIKWTMMDRNKGSVVLGNLYSLRPNQIIIQPKPRPYRTLENVSHPQKGNDTQKLESVNRILSEQYDKFTIIVDYTTIILKTENIDFYRPNIINIGGNITSSMTAEFPINKKAKIEEFIFSSLPNAIQKKDFVCRRWVRDRLELLYDIKELLYPSRPYTSLLKLLGLRGTNKSADFPKYISSTIEEVGISQKFCSRIQKHLIPNESKILNLIKKGAGRSEVVKYILASLKWKDPELFNLELIVDTMKTLHKTNTDINITPLVVVLVFLPVHVRDKARRYISKNYPNEANLDPSKVIQQFLLDHKDKTLISFISERCSLIRVTPSSSQIELSSPVLEDGTLNSQDSNGEKAEELPMEKLPVIEPLVTESIAPSDSPSEKDKIVKGVKPDLKGEVKTGNVTDISADIETLETDIPIITNQGGSFSNRYLLVISNASTINIPKSTPSEKITWKVYQKYKYASIYGPRSNKPYTPGNIVVKPNPDSKNENDNTIKVITLIAEYLSGKPKKKVDTYEARKTWFEECMKKVSEIVKEKDSVTFFSDSLSEGYRDILQSTGLTVYITTPGPPPGGVSKASLTISKNTNLKEEVPPVKENSTVTAKDELQIKSEIQASDQKSEVEKQPVKKIIKIVKKTS